MEGERIIIENRGAIYAIAERDIFYLEQVGRKVNVHVSGQTYSFYGKLSETGKLLDRNFFMSHGSCIFNMEQIVGIRGQEIYFSDGSNVAFGKRSTARFREIFRDYVAKSF